MLRNWTLATLVVVVSASLALPLSAQNRQSFQLGPRRPAGIYAKVNISSEINTHPNYSMMQFEAYFINLYLQMLNNPAVSGLVLQAHWDQLQSQSSEYRSALRLDFYLDEAFTQVDLWNSQNPTKPRKTIQFIITPGFQSPQWVLNQIPSCDGLFEVPATTPPANCGRVTFTGYLEEQDSTQLPLPWNPFYKAAWRAFLVVLNARYGSNPALVSISVAGPTAASEEMIVPNDSNSNNPRTTFGTPLTWCIHQEESRRTTCGLRCLHSTIPICLRIRIPNRAFIDEWDAAIDMYGEIFQGVTLVATTGSGLPNFSPGPFPIPPGFSADCGNPNMDCAAETTILSHFVNPFVDLLDAKATQPSGLEASRATNTDLGLLGVGLLSRDTENFLVPSAQILGGAQFNTSVANSPSKEGGNTEFPSPSVEQGLYNVLQVFFNGTPVAGQYYETNGGIPLNYLQIYYPDFLYAAENGPAAVMECRVCSTVNISAQTEFGMASQWLFMISDPLPPFPLF